MMKNPAPQTLTLTFTDIRLYLISSLFIAGNLLFPWVLHHFGSSGQIFLPLYFFSLLAGLAFGWRCGLFTGLVSPLLSYLYSGMPILAILPFVLLKSTILGGVSGLLTEKSSKIFVAAFLAVAITQISGSPVIYLVTHNSRLGLLDITSGYPGLLLQIFLAPLLARLIRRHGDQAVV